MPDIGDLLSSVTNFPSCIIDIEPGARAYVYTLIAWSCLRLAARVLASSSSSCEADFPASKRCPARPLRPGWHGDAGLHLSHQICWRGYLTQSFGWMGGRLEVARKGQVRLSDTPLTQRDVRDAGGTYPFSASRLGIYLRITAAKSRSDTGHGTTSGLCRFGTGASSRG